MRPIKNTRRLPTRLEYVRAFLVMWIVAAGGPPAAAQVAAPPPLLRFPDASRDRIVFVAQGDLWIVARGGGTATRLTNGLGQVFLPRFAPDGRSIAFTWRRAGLSDVWLIPAEGGVPRRLTYGPSSNPYDNMVAGWSSDGHDVLFLSARRSAFSRHDVAAYAVAASGGPARAFPMETSGLLSEAPDGKAIAFDRTFRTFGGDRWKRYTGGQAPAIYVYDLRSGRQTRITQSAGTDTAPMWWQNRLYFLSDRGLSHRLDLWVADRAGHDPRQVTHVTDLDIDVPALGDGAINFGFGGRIWCLDLPSERLREVSISVPLSERVREQEVAVASSVRATDIAGGTNEGLSPDGNSAVFAAHGQLFVLGLAGSSVNLHAGPLADDDHPAVAQDGQMIAFITNGADGEQEVATMPLTGGPVRRLTAVRGFVFGMPVWSPDSTKLAVPDEEHGLWIVATNGAPARRVAVDPIAAIRDARFSPDGRSVAYSTTLATGAHALHLLDVRSGRDVVATPNLESDHAPAFSEDGRTLFFLAARHEHPILSDRDEGPDIATTESDGLYEVTLPGAPALPESGFTKSAISVPVAPGVLSDPTVRGATLFYMTKAPALVDGTLPGALATLHALDTRTGRDRVVAASAAGAVISGDGTVALLRRGVEWHHIDISTGLDRRLDLKSLRLSINPRADWQKGVDEAWHLDRDLFWDRTLHGLDWPAIGARYQALARIAGSHEDEVYILGEMQGELSSSHMFVDGGRDGDDDSHGAPTPLLGADFEVDPQSGLYRLAHVYRGDPSRPRFRAPLGAPGLRVRDGEFLLAIDGQSLRVPDDPYSLLAGRTGPVTLRLSSKVGGPDREVTVDPVASEVAIRQLDWINRNGQRISALSGRQVGYVYLSNFAEAGTEDFARQYYAQTGKPGLVIDERWNSGGFTSQWVVSVLRRPMEGYFVNREGGITPLPGSRPPPSMAVVTNIFTASDGDQFSFFMRFEHLATIVGERTWGGVAGIIGAWPLLDGTTVTIPKDRLLAADGNPILENKGAEPDILVSDTSSALAAGHDAQLEKAVAVVMAKLRNQRDDTAPK